ncbi:MAG: hypothetical protein DWI22_19560 [Planctomycetota bacterium]|nr:MAG: hypothetical protein DWI22_19560 [Planctomycetota bacterium]
MAELVIKAAVSHGNFAKSFQRLRHRPRIRFVQPKPVRLDLVQPQHDRGCRDQYYAAESNTSAHNRLFN